MYVSEVVEVPQWYVNVRQYVECIPAWAMVFAHLPVSKG